MAIIAFLLTILAIVCAIGSFTCFILVLISMFKHEEQGLGWATIALTFCTGIGPLFALVMGIVKHKEWNLSRVVLGWVGCILVGGCATTAAFVMWTSMAVQTAVAVVDSIVEDLENAENKDFTDDIPITSIEIDEESPDSEPADDSPVETEWIDEELNDEQTAAHEAAADSKNLDAQLTDEFDDSEITIARLLELLAHENSAVRARAAEKIRYLRQYDEEKIDKQEIPVVLAALETALFDENLIVRRKASWALQEFGEDAVSLLPALIKTIRSHDVYVAEGAIDAIANIGPGAEAAVPDLIAELKRDRYYTKDSVALALSKIGFAARPAIPQLVREIEREEFGRALGALGAKDELLAAAKHSAYGVRMSGVIGLAHVRPTTVEIVNVLGAAMEDENEYVRQTAAKQFGNIDPKLPDAVPYLMAAVRSEDEDVRQQAATALAKFEIDPKTQVLAILPQLNDSVEYNRVMAAQALGEMGKPAIPILFEVITDQARETRIRSGALKALSGLADDDEDRAQIVPFIHQRAKDMEESIDVRAAGVVTLRYVYYDGEDFPEQLRDEILIEAITKATDDSTRIEVISMVDSNDIKAAVPALITALSNGNKQVVKYAASALGEMEEAALPAITPLIDALKNRRAEDSSSIATALGEIGPPAKAAIPELTRLLSDRDSEYSPEREALTAIAKIQVDSPKLPEFLGRYLGEDSDYRSTAAELLGKIGPGAKSQTQLLIPVLEDEDQFTRSYAAESLGQIDADPAIAGPPLLKCLADESHYVREAAATSLGQLKPPADQVLPKLLPLMKDETSSVRVAATGAIAAYGPEAAMAVPQLVEALDASSDSIRVQAAYALGRIGKPSAEGVPKLIERFEATNDSWSEELAATARALVRLAPTVEPANAWFRAALDDDDKLETIANAFMDQSEEELFRIVKSMLEDSDTNFRLHAIGILGHYSESPELIATLESAFDNDREEVRGAAALRLNNLGVEFDQSAMLSSYIAALASDDESQANDASYTIYSMGRRAVPELVKVFVDDQASLAQRTAVTRVLDQLSGSARKAIPALKQALSSPLPEIRIAAATALAGIEPEECPLEIVIEGIQHSDPKLRIASMEATSLYSFRDQSSEAVPSLLANLEHEDEETRRTAVSVLTSINQDQTIAPKLLALMTDPEHVSLILPIFQTLDPKPEPVLHALIAALAHEDEQTTYSAVKQLASAEAQSLPYLTKFISTASESAPARALAVKAIGQMGEAGRPAAKAVRALLKEDDATLRFQAAIAIGRMGGANQAILDELVRGLASDEY